MLCTAGALHTPGHLFVCLQFVLGRDGFGMAQEVLPPQLLARSDAAWRKWCKANTAEPLYPSSSSMGKDRTLPPGCDAALWTAHQTLSSWLQSHATAAAGGSMTVQHILLPDTTGRQDEPNNQLQLQPEVLGAWLLVQPGPMCERMPPAVMQQQQRRQPTVKACGFDWPAGWPSSLQQPLRLEQQQQQHMCGVSDTNSRGGATSDSSGLQQQQPVGQCQSCVLLLCRPEWYSTNEPQQPLGAALAQLNLVKAALQQLQPEPEQQIATYPQQETEGSAGVSAAFAAAPAVAAVRVPLTWQPGQDS